MIILKELAERDYESAMALRIHCWTEELNGKGENRLELEKEVEDLREWLSEADVNSDHRLMVGAFEDDTFLGFAAASFAETFDVEKNGFELNYLFVHEEYRGRYISLKLLDYLVDVFSQKGCTDLVVYNHHFAPSNEYYSKLGASVIRQEVQGRDQLLIDVFKLDVGSLKIKLKNRLSK